MAIKDVYNIDCSACKIECGMVATKIPKYNIFLRLIGIIMIIPSLIGIIISSRTLYSLSEINSRAMHDLPEGTTERAETLTYIAQVTGDVGLYFIGFLIVGLIGWMFLMKRKVFKCSNCGFILERS